MEPNGEAWFQQPSTVHPRRRRPQPAPFLNPVALIITTSVLTLLVLFFLVPSFLSQAIQLLRPNSVKKSWDSLNILLVLFAILCGVFARWNDESPPPDNGLADLHRINSAGVSNVSNFVNRPRPSVSAWMDLPEYGAAGNISGGGSGLRRNSSSYPDLRQESLWDSGGNRPSRFFDDFEVNFYRSPPPEIRRRRSHETEREEAETIVREIPVDKFEISSAPPPPTPPKSPTPPPAAPPPPKANLKRRRSLRSVPRKEKVERQRDETEVSNKQRPVPPPAPPSPPAPPPVESPEEPSVEVHRKKSGATKEFATAIASLYKGQRKRKNKVKSRNIYVSAAEGSSPPPSAVEPQSAPPPPPPPPPPTSNVFQNPFKKSGKSKRVHSVSVSTTAPPPPPPPPPPDSIFNNLFKTGSISKRFLQSSAPHSTTASHSTTAPPPPPPPPPPSSIFNTIFKNSNKNRRSKNVTTSPPLSPPQAAAVAAAAPPRRRPLNSGKPPKPTRPVIIAPPSPLIPLPPPPPPFRMAEAKFVAQGDYVRIRSTHTSRESSPELEDVDVMSVKSDGGDSIGPSISCPSPDVNAKADSFIARLRDEWKLEKMNSVREKRRFS